MPMSRANRLTRVRLNLRSSATKRRIDDINGQGSNSMNDDATMLSDTVSDRLRGAGAVVVMRMLKLKATNTQLIENARALLGTHG